MKKILTMYIIGTILPIILFLIEKNIPYKLLEKITILSKDIYYSNYYGILETVIIIIISLIILRLFYNKKSYLFHVYLNSKSIILITLYSFYRIINSGFFFLKFGSYSREQIQIIESISRIGFKGLIIPLLNSIFPLIVTLTFSSYLSLSKDFNKKYKMLILFIIIILGFSSLLFDLTRGSRGSISIYSISLLIGYLITFKDSVFKLNLKKIFPFLLISYILITIFISNTFYRSTRFSKNSYGINLNSNSEKLNFLKSFHDSTIAKALGGQLVINKGIRGEMMLTNTTTNPFSFRKDININSITTRDNYCKENDCLHLFQPLHKIFSIFGYSNKVNSIYISLIGDFPFNSGSHLGSLYIVFKRNIAPFVYLLLIFLNATLIKFKSNYIQFISIFNIFYFSFFAFTDNWFMSYYPYISILIILLAKYLNIKILRIKRDNYNFKA